MSLPRQLPVYRNEVAFPGLIQLINFQLKQQPDSLSLTINSTNLLFRDSFVIMWQVTMAAKSNKVVILQSIYVNANTMTKLMYNARNLETLKVCAT